MYSEDDFFRLRELRYKPDLSPQEEQELNDLSEKEREFQATNPMGELSNVDPEWLKAEEEKKRLEMERVKREGIETPSVEETSAVNQTEPVTEVTPNAEPQTPDQNIPQDFIPADDQTHQESQG